MNKPLTQPTQPVAPDEALIVPESEIVVINRTDLIETAQGIRGCVDLGLVYSTDLVVAAAMVALAENPTPYTFRVFCDVSEAVTRERLAEWVWLAEVKLAEIFAAEGVTTFPEWYAVWVESEGGVAGPAMLDRVFCRRGFISGHVGLPKRWLSPSSGRVTEVPMFAPFAASVEAVEAEARLLIDEQ